jgi:hypothetical protein
LLWGHGESPWKIARNVVITILFLSIFQTLFKEGIWNGYAQNFIWELLKFVKNDAKIFVGITIEDINDFSKIVLILLRYLTLGLFIRILFNKYSWR